MSVSVIVMMISWVFAYVQTHQMVHIKDVQFFVYQLYLEKLFLRNDCVDF